MADPGVMPQLARAVFELASEKSREIEAKAMVLELYQDQLIDLLDVKGEFSGFI